MNQIKNKEEMAYLRLLKNIIINGEEKSDRTETGTFSIFSPDNLRFSLKNNRIPLLTTKKMFTKGIIEELLFFISGKTNTKVLEDKGVNIWKGNTSRFFLDKRGLHHLPEGDIGKGYGYQWRSFGKEDKMFKTECGTREEHYFEPGVDQLKKVFESLKNDPHSRRHLIIAWNPLQEKDMTLPCCHYAIQFYVNNNNELSCLFIMRSVDALLGAPFNIASYAILTHIFAKALGYTANELILSMGDAHVYKNHIDQADEQMNRIPFEFPTLTINKEINSVKDIETLQFEDFQINDYKCHPAIKAPMAV